MTTDKSTSGRSVIFGIFSKIAFFLAGATVIYDIYHLFFFVDQTWLHGSISMAWGFLASLLWLLIFLVFRNLLSKRLHFKKANALINIYLAFSAVSTWVAFQLVYDMLSFYFSAEDGMNLNYLQSQVGQTISRAILLMLSTYGSYFILILIGIVLSKYKEVEAKLFSALGWTLVVAAAMDFLDSFTDPDLNFLILLIKAGAMALIGLALKRVNEADLALVSPEKPPTAHQVAPLAVEKSEPKTVVPQPPLTPTRAPEKSKNTKSQVTPKVTTPPKPTRPKRKSRNAEQEPSALPLIDLEKLADIDLIRTYYEGLADTEKRRLQAIIQKRYGAQRNLEDQDVLNLVFQHIAAKKLYDHGRFFPGS